MKRNVACTILIVLSAVFSIALRFATGDDAHSDGNWGSEKDIVLVVDPIDSTKRISPTDPNVIWVAWKPALKIKLTAQFSGVADDESHREFIYRAKVAVTGPGSQSASFEWKEGTVSGDNDAPDDPAGVDEGLKIVYPSAGQPLCETHKVTGDAHDHLAPNGPGTYTAVVTGKIRAVDHVHSQIVYKDLGPKTYTINIVMVDLDVDSDNDNALSSPGCTPEEDEIEDNSTKPGKFVRVNDGYKDNDNIPDFADGFDKFPAPADENLQEKFIPIVLQLSENIDLAKAKIRFTYPASDPNGVTRQGSAPNITYTTAAGEMRIWTKNGSEKRQKASVAAEAAESRGHFVPAATGPTDAGFLLSNLGTPDSAHKLTLFIEGIAPSATMGGSQIKVEIDPKGEGATQFVTTDTVRVTIVKVDLKVKDVVPDDEYTRGSIVARNTDNDDYNDNPAALNFEPDWQQNATPKEGDLQEIEIAVLPKDIKVGELWLEISAGAAGPAANDTRFKVWEKSTKDNKLLVDGSTKVKKWNMSAIDFNTNVKHFLEGIQRSNDIKDAELTLSFHPNADPTKDAPAEDKVKYTVVELILDVNRDNTLTDDNERFRPGYDTVTAGEGNPVITAANNWRQQLQLVAAPFNFQDANDYPIADKATFKIVETTAFRGVAMNRGYQTENDYSFASATSTTTSDVDSVTTKQARQDFYCKDYGGRARIEVEIYRGTKKLAVCELRLPLDTDRDELPDFFESQYRDDPVRQAIAGGAAAVQVFDVRDPQTKAVGAIAAMNSRLWDREEQIPQGTGVPANGITGDGLIAFEEYRGFVYEGRHHRTSPHHKDVFGFSEVNDVNAAATDLGLGFLPGAVGASIRVHRIVDNEWDGSALRSINFNRLGIADATLQRALYITDNARPGFGSLGVTRGMINTGVNGVCNTTVPNRWNVALRLDTQVIQPNCGLADQPALGTGANGAIDPHVENGDKIDWQTLRIVSNTPDGHLHTLALPIGAHANGYAADDRIRGNIGGQDGKLMHATVMAIVANDVLRGTIRPLAGNALQHATVAAINANDVLRGTIVEGADNQINKATVTSGGGNDNHSQLKVEPGADGTLETPIHANDVAGPGNTILPGANNILDSAANLAATDIIRGTIQEGADNKLDSRPSNANDIVEGRIEEGANNVLDSRPANANDVVHGTIEEGADNALGSRPAAGSTDFVIGHVEDGGNGFLDPTVNNAGANIAGSGGVAAANDDVYDHTTRQVFTGPDGIRNTNPQIGADDIEIIAAAGNGTPFVMCIDPDDTNGTDVWQTDDFVDTAAAGDDVRSNSNTDINETGYCFVNVPSFNQQMVFYNQMAAGPPVEVSLVAVECRVGQPAPAEANRQRLINRTICHELGHHMHMEHYNHAFNPAPPPSAGTHLCVPAAGHTAAGSTMSQTGTTIWPIFNHTFDDTDLAQLRLHQKHP